MTVISNGRAMDHANVLHALREAGSVEDSLGERESNTMKILRNGQASLVRPDMNNTLAVRDE
jgi:hypothetical protein